MQPLNRIAISVFEKDRGNEKKVVATLHRLVPVDWDNEKIRLEQHTATGIEGDRIAIFLVTVEKQRHLNVVMDALLAGLGALQISRINKEKVSRLDEDLHFFLRLDKEALEQGIYKLTDRGDCYHIKMSIATYPKSMTAGLKVIDALFPA